MTGFLIEIKPVTIYSPISKGYSTIDLEGLNFRIRNGNGCCPFSKATGKLINNYVM
jgi:hypothetical protein